MMGSSTRFPSSRCWEVSGVSPPPKSPLPLEIWAILSLVPSTRYSICTLGWSLLYSCPQMWNTGTGELPPDPTRVMASWATHDDWQSPIVSASADAALKTLPYIKPETFSFGALPLHQPLLAGLLIEGIRDIWADVS